jgi:serralysin
MGLPGIQVNGRPDNDDLFGTRADDVMAGADGNDTLHSGLGSDFVYGGNGDDTVFVDLGDDWYIGGAGIDTLNFSTIDASSDGIIETNTLGVTFDLARVGLQDLGFLGRDTFFGFENVTGGDGGDTLLGDAGVNTIDGGIGNDRLDGRAGNDMLLGQVGADTMTGGLGADDLFASAMLSGNDNARDVFRYIAVADSGIAATTRDDIFGFVRGAATTADRIDLQAIDANPFLAGNQAFKFIGGAAFTVKVVGEVRIVKLGGDLLISIDTDKDNAPEMTILVHATATLTAGDFVL